MEPKENQGTTGKSPEALFLDALLEKLQDIPNQNLGTILLGYINGSVEGYSKVNNDKIACKKGCNHCCKFMVAVSPPEAIAIYRYLLETRTIDKLVHLKKWILKRVRDTTGLNTKEYWEKTKNEGCLFLNNEGACSIYPIRPRACSSMIVSDATPCIEGHETLLRHVIPQNMSIIGYMALSKELRKRGLQSGMYEFNNALLTLFSDPNAIEKWLHGEQVFQGNMAPGLDDKIHLEVFS